MASIQKRGNSYRVRIVENQKTIKSRSFASEGEANAWGKEEDAKLYLKKRLGIELTDSLAKLPKGTVLVYPGDAPARLLDEQPTPRYQKSDSQFQGQPRLPSDVSGVTSQKGGPTFADLAERYQKDVLPNQRGWRQERYRVRGFIALPFAKRPITKLTRDDFVRVQRARIKDGLANDTINREITLAMRIFNIARDEWKISWPRDADGNSFNPAKIKCLPADEERYVRLSKDEAVCLLKHAAAHRNGLVINLVLRLCLEINFRRGELFAATRDAITWPNENEKDGRLYLPGTITKNGKPRAVPLTSRSVAILREVIASIPTDSSNRLFPIEASYFGQQFREVRGEAARDMPTLATFRFHDTRHQAISVMATKIGNVTLLARATGHRDTKSLLRYVNPRTSELAALLE
jgi:integrase